MIRDVVPPDDRIRCKLINDDEPGAPNGDVSTSSTWTENGGGEWILDQRETSPNKADLAGVTAFTATGTGNRPRRRIADPNRVGIRLTTPEQRQADAIPNPFHPGKREGRDLRGELLRRRPIRSEIGDDLALR